VPLSTGTIHVHITLSRGGAFITKKFIVTKEVAHFNYAGRKYLPGETVELPDELQTETCSFLKPAGRLMVQPTAVPVDAMKAPMKQEKKRTLPFGKRES